MEFITNIIMLITSFFGWGEPAATLVAPVPVAEERMEEANKSEVATLPEEIDEANTITSPATINQSAPTKLAEVAVPAEPIVKKNMWLQYKKPTEAELKASLEGTVFRVTQKNGTEFPGSSPLNKNTERGIYVDVLSGEPLYSSKDKYDSGTGWPSFTKPITPEAVTEHEDNILFYKRTEIRSAIGDNHLGHVFTDGPKDSTGLRYCMNGVSLRFIPEAEMEAAGYGDYLQYL